MEFEIAESDTSQERKRDLGAGLCSKGDQFKTINPAGLVLKSRADSQLLLLSIKMFLCMSGMASCLEQVI